jgi:hypothetical protein
MAKSNDNQPIHTMLKLEDFGTYDLEYDVGRVPVILEAKSQEIPKIQFSQNFLEKKVIAGDLDIVYQEEGDQIRSKDLSTSCSNKYRVLYFIGQL